MLTHLQDMAGAGVGHRDNTGLRRQGLQPVRQSILRVLPQLRRGFQPLVYYAPAFPTGRRQSVKGETVDAFLFQMQEGALDQSMVIGGDVMYRRVIFREVLGTAYAYDGNVNVDQQTRDFRIVVVGNHAIA